MLTRCPFCGGEVHIILCDDEGNHRLDSYADDPWSGLGYLLYHSEVDNPDCPIAHEEDSQFGRRIYDTPEQAEEAWNQRVEQEHCPFCGAGADKIKVSISKGKIAPKSGKTLQRFSSHVQCRACKGRGPVVSALLPVEENLSSKEEKRDFMERKSILKSEALRFWRGRA